MHVTIVSLVLLTIMSQLVVANLALTSIDSIRNTLPIPSVYTKQQVVRLRRTPYLDQFLIDEGIDVWTIRNDTVDVRIYTPNKLDYLMSHVDHLNPTVLVKDVQTIVDDEARQLTRHQHQWSRHHRVMLARQQIPLNWHDSYHRLAEIEYFFMNLSLLHPNLVSIERFGQTYQQRQFLRVSIGLQSSPSSSPPLSSPSLKTKKADHPRIWIQAMQHAREWIAGATVQYIAERLVSGYGTDPDITWLLNNAEIVMIPVANPDGYEFSWTRERLWRKNRHPITRRVVGVDTNRNWPDHWNAGGSSRNPRSEVYMGSGPASELEVQSLMEAFRATPNVVGAIDYHSYAQLFLYPVGYTKQHTKHQQQYLDMGKLFRKAVGNRTEFKLEQSSELYIASGGVDDWWYGNDTARERGYHVPGLCIELNPDEENPTGFIIPPSEIRAIGEEQTRGLMALALYFIHHPLS